VLFSNPPAAEGPEAGGAGVFFSTTAQKYLTAYRSNSEQNESKQVNRYRLKTVPLENSTGTQYHCSSPIFNRKSDMYTFRVKMDFTPQSRKSGGKVDEVPWKKPEFTPQATTSGVKSIDPYHLQHVYLQDV
jgi:hypothetical protein